MGSYCHLEIGGHPLLWSKSYVDAVLMTLFDESDRLVSQRRVRDRNPAADRIDPEDDEMETVYEYRLDAAAAKQRLDIMGFTIEQSRIAFDTRLREMLDDSDAENDSFFYGPSWLEDDVERRTFIANLSFERWGASIGTFLASGCAPIRAAVHENKPLVDPLVQFIADGEDEEFIFGFPRCDARLFIRAVLEYSDERFPVVLDYSELVAGGYYQGNEDLANRARVSIQREFVSTAKTIVLTEGSTDAEFLAKSLEVLFPHLVSLYSFIDFAGPNMEGGVGNLVKIVKAFIGSGIVNRVIALFDNDTAAADALRALHSVRLPDQFRILQYPPIPYATNYPTLGPQGNVNIDVNGLAGSIELYFGMDILSSEGEPVPVQWKGYIQKLEKYQGEILDKPRLQAAFRKKLASATRGNISANSADWVGIRLVLESIFAAFTPVRDV